MANDTAGSPALRLPWAGKQIRIEEVDTFLSSLWRMSVDNMRTAANLSVRTSVLNLVICTPDIKSARYASKVLRDLSSTHLARATIVILDTDASAPDAIDSWATLRCFSMISDVMRHCFEQTTIRTSGKATRALSSILPGVLKAHLPVYLWWIGDTKSTDHAIFRSVAEMSQRVIADSATFVQPTQNIHALANYCKTNPAVALSDLNWGRLTPWRQLLAQFFDVPEYLPFLTGIEKIEIEHAIAPSNTSQAETASETSPNPNAALLLAGWLKARLGMTMATTGMLQHVPDAADGTYQWRLNQPNSEIQTLLQIQPHALSDLQPGAIFMVRLTCRSDGKPAIFMIKRDVDMNYALTSVESPLDTRPMRTVQLPARHDANELLRNELEIMGHDELFEQALQEVEMLLTEEQD